MNFIVKLIGCTYDRSVRAVSYAPEKEKRIRNTEMLINLIHNLSYDNKKVFNAACRSGPQARIKV